MPTLTMIAGPNGSGKSSITASRYFGPPQNIVDPDAMATSINSDNPAQAALAAGRQAILLAREFVDRRESFAVETTLAGNGQLALLKDARQAGFELVVIYIALNSVEVQVERVRLRASRGGHTVPEDDIRRRYARSLLNALKALQLANTGLVLDNTGSRPFQMLEVSDGRVVWKRQGNLPQWVLDVERALTQSPSAPTDT